MSGWARRAHELRFRLMRPLNAVEDQGINLRRNRSHGVRPGVKRVVVIEAGLPPPPPKAAAVPIPKPPAAKVSGRHTHLAPIIKTCAHHFGVSVRDILGSSRLPRVTYPRQVAAYLCRDITGFSLSRIGNLFRKDHTTILYSYQKISALIKTCPRTLLDVTVIRGNYEKFINKPPIPSVSKPALEINLSDWEAYLPGPKVHGLATGIDGGMADAEAERLQEDQHKIQNRDQAVSTG